jgi:predicted TIM-barrel fold metal-dependent hydrolase
LERGQKAGARGVGELSDKGRGLSGAPGLHFDDARLDALIEKCADLKMPINIHIGEDEWMYQPMDEHNDGLMNGYTWRIAKDPAVLGHDEVLQTLDNALQKHTRTTIIACHFANCCADLNRLGAMLDKYPNLYADMGARFSEITPIPRFVQKFFAKYQDRLLYGTDNTPAAGMYQTSFRILESDDEHFYPTYFSKYHWPAHGFALPDSILKKIYRDNALKITQGTGN